MSMKPGEGYRCSFCTSLNVKMRQAGRNPHGAYLSVIQVAMELEQKGSLELLAGDCPLKDAEKVLDAEEHYTVCHYLRCRQCGTLFFIGACIRGTPIYRRMEELPEEKLSHLLWGRCGSYFEKTPDVSF